MQPFFVDLHIHTSDNPDSLNTSYDLDILKQKVDEVAEGSQSLISLTDHNTVNKSIYLKAGRFFPNLLLGVELHVRNYDNAKPYHCHIYFDLPEIAETSIDNINTILDKLYPKKIVTNDDTTIPKLEKIMNSFDSYDFLLLPHGGQNHSTFDVSIPADVKFDNTLERSIYYNHFDGFTARSNDGLEKTQSYFERLGIKEFVNLVTVTDNYFPEQYPSGKSKDAAPFVKTWILASPTFKGLRLALSESSRLKYGVKPDTWAECIKHVSLKNDFIDLDANLTPGLNVVIGGSSSGKSLFVDSVYRKIADQLDNSEYRSTSYRVQDIVVNNPTGQVPHYIPQNYIMKICDKRDEENTIDNISILRSVFPADKDEKREIANGLSELSTKMASLVQSVKEIQSLHEELLRIPRLSRLIVTEVIHGNPIKLLAPSDGIIGLFSYSKAIYDQNIKELDRIDSFLSSNPLIQHDKELVKGLKQELALAFERSVLESLIRDVIIKHEKEIDDAKKEENKEITTKRQQFEKLLDCIKKYFRNYVIFYESLQAISKVSIKIQTKEIDSMGHKLFIANEFELTKGKFLEVVNEHLKSEKAIKSFDDICPELLFECNFKKRAPKVESYSDFENKINARFAEMNRKTYRITTREGKDFDKLSAGWKTSVILDLILGWGDDTAPLIIDQPEDNLATGYINSGLLNAIKACKTKKQIILVSHNATIPMLGDAQNVVICKNVGNFITIKSNLLEGSVDGKDVVDWIADTTDGGKISIKKRVKKYNLKKFRSENEVNIPEE